MFRGNFGQGLDLQQLYGTGLGSLGFRMQSNNSI
jgi:hypothetical protein